MAAAMVGVVATDKKLKTMKQKLKSEVFTPSAAWQRRGAGGGGGGAG
jgi:hypothetical protein